MYLTMYHYSFTNPIEFIFMIQMDVQFIFLSLRSCGHQCIKLNSLHLNLKMIISHSLSFNLYQHDLLIGYKLPRITHN